MDSISRITLIPTNCNGKVGECIEELKEMMMDFDAIQHTLEKYGLTKLEAYNHSRISANRKGSRLNLHLYIYIYIYIYIHYIILYDILVKILNHIIVHCVCIVD